MKVIATVCIALLASGCTSTAVRCDGRLTPINPPTALTSPSADSEKATERKP